MAAAVLNGDGGLCPAVVSVNWTGQARGVRFIREEEGGPWWVILDDAMEALDVPNTRLAMQDAFLCKIGPRDEAWTWLRVGRDFYRCLRLSHLPTYCDMLLEDYQLHGTEAQAASEWAQRQLSIGNIRELAIRRKRGRREPSPAPEPEPEEQEDEYADLLRLSSSSSDEDEDEQIAFPVAVEADDDAEEVELAFEDIQQLSALHAQRIQTCAMMLNALPEDNPERVHLQVVMHNSNAVLDALHPVTNPRKLRRVTFPTFPPVGRQVRVSERIRALGYDMGDVSADDMMTIGQHAVANYRAGPFAGPWAVTAWAGNRRVVRVHYTEETQHYIDDAIRVVLGPAPGE